MASSMLSRARPAPPTGLDLDKTALFSSVAHSTPIRCVQLSNNPSAHIYHALKIKVERSSAPWLREFLELDGLGSLVEAVEQLSSARFTGFSNAILLIDCLACVRAVLNATTGMNYFLNSDIYARKLVKGLSTGSVLCKKNIFELLTAICIYSHVGYNCTMDALQHYQKCTDQTSQYSIILQELKLSDTTCYRTALMSLVNTLINCTEDIQHRAAIRNELISCQLLDLMHHFRRDENDADLAIQLEAFSISKHRDDLELAQNLKINPNSHQELFTAIYQEVLGTPDTATFMSLLQDLYLMSSTSNDSSFLWKAVGKTVRYISTLPSSKEAGNIVNGIEALARPPATCADTKSSGYVRNRVHTIQNIVSECSGERKMDRKDSGISMGSSYSGNSSRSSSFHRQGSGTRSSQGSGKMTRITETENDSNVRRTWSKNMKNIKWIKVGKAKVRREVSLWGQGTENRLRPDYKVLEQEFSLPDRPRDADDEVELLTGAQSVIINVYLARMDMSAEELVGYLEEGDDAKIGLSGLRSLMSVLPSHEEIVQLRNFRGERYDLGQAEQFLLYLSDLPDYRTLLSCLLFKAEFAPRYQKLKTAFTAMLKASRDILHHQGLKDFLFLTLDAGNFMNHGSVYGSASGMRLSSLMRVLDVKGKDPSASLLDCLVRMAEAQCEEVLTFISDIPQLQIAASHDLEEMKVEVTNLSTELRKVLTQLATTHNDVKSTFEYFIEDVKQDLQQLQDSITQLRSLSQQMALYFCEDESTFRLHIALRQIHAFCEAIKKRMRDGIHNRKQRTLAELRQNALKEKCIENRMARVFGKQAGANSTFMMAQTERVVDGLLNEVHSGNIIGGQGDDMKTPDLEWDDLHMSQIAAVSPIEELPLPALEEDDMFRPCLPDRIEDVIGQQYRKDNQVASSSFLSPENHGRDAGNHRQATLASPEEEFQIKRPSRPAAPPQAAVRPQPVTTVDPGGTDPHFLRSRPVTHCRTASDPNESRNVDRKLADYVSKKSKPKKKVRLESNLPIASLERDADSHRRSEDDILRDVENKENAAPDNKEKKKKRSSFGLLKKLTRALKPKNSEDIPKRENGIKVEKAVRPTSLPINGGKENIGFSDSTQNPSERSYKVYESRTTLEEVHEEPLYKIVVYQKYIQSEC